MDSLIGQSLGRYQILEQLGEGGMATVYKANDTLLERLVAIKVIRTDQFAPALLEQILKRFEREAKALAKLSHPNIVHVHDYGQYSGAPYLVMEYLPCGSLSQMSDKPMAWQQALQILLPIAQALAYAHEHHVVHRDIKPANILLTENGLPMLSDFGIAKILEDNEGGTLTGSGMTIGTPSYMAPEQWMGQSGPQSDIYSLGVVFYELVTGRKPYTADTPASIMLKQATEPLPYPSQFVPGLPKELENALLKAMEKRPEDRYQTMNEFASALEELAGGHTLAAEAKIEEGQAAETQVAPGRSQPATKTIPEVQIPPENQPRTSGIRWRRWIPISALAVLVCVGVVAGAFLVIKGMNGRNSPAAPPENLTTPTLAAVPTQLSPQIQTDSQASLFTQTPNPAVVSPHAEIKVLWDISHVPRKSADGSLYTPQGMYLSLAKTLSNQNFVISSGDLTNISSYDILVLSATSASTKVYSSAEADEIENFVRKSGHGLLILSDNPSFENLADSVANRFSITLGELTSDGPASFSNEPFFSGVTSIQFLFGGGIFQVSSPSQTAAVDKGGNSVIAFCECDAGRVLAISDANLWDNQGLNQADNQRLAINTFLWLAKLSP